MNEKELQDIEFEYAPYTDEGSQQVKALVAEVRRSHNEYRLFRHDAGAEIERLRAALDKIMHELGVPQPGYLAPVANAYYIAEEALKGGAQ